MASWVASSDRRLRWSLRMRWRQLMMIKVRPARKGIFHKFQCICSVQVIPQVDREPKCCWWDCQRFQMQCKWWQFSKVPGVAPGLIKRCAGRRPWSPNAKCQRASTRKWTADRIDRGRRWRRTGTFHRRYSCKKPGKRKRKFIKIL